MIRLRAILSGVALLAIVAFSFYLQHMRDRANRLDDALATIARERELHAGYVAQVEADRTARDSADRSYTDEISALRADYARRPVPVVRLCPPAAPVPVPATARTDAGDDAARAAPGLVPAGTGEDPARSRDIGPDLYRLIERADSLSAQLRAIHQYEEAGDGR